jgi:GT2 family glycosyltransferase
MKDRPLVSVIIPTYNRKKKLIRLVYSIKRSSYPKDRIEIIAIDDASTDGTFDELKRSFPEVKIVRNEKELLVSGSRNAGIKSAKGNYVFLIDDDNIVDRNCISELVEVMEKYSDVGVVAPIMYYFEQPDRVWCAGIERNMVTSQTKFIGKNTVDNNQFNELIESKDFPNAFMVKKEVLEKAGLFDEDYFPIHYEEADLGERIRRRGYRIVCNPKAKVWHDIPLPERVKDKARLFCISSELRAYYAGRNRVLFHKKYSKWWQFLIFILFFNWIFAFFYLNIVFFKSEKPFDKRGKIAKNYLKGIFDSLGLVHNIC